MKRVSQGQWDKLAQFCAEDAHECNFSSRRGVYPLDVPAETSEVLCVYNNNPYAADAALRDDETARLRKRLKAAKIEELAYATYPPESGYTYAMILAGGEEQLRVVRDLVIEVTRESFAALKNAKEHVVSQAAIPEIPHPAPLQPDPNSTESATRCAAPNAAER